MYVYVLDLALEEYQEPPSAGHFEQQEHFEEVPGDAEEFTRSYQEYEDF